MSDEMKWQDFYSRNFTPWDSGKPEPHLVAAFVARAKVLGLSLPSTQYSSDEDEDKVECQEHDIFEEFAEAIVAKKFITYPVTEFFGPGRFTTGRRQTIE